MASPPTETGDLHAGVAVQSLMTDKPLVELHLRLRRADSWARVRGIGEAMKCRIAVVCLLLLLAAAASLRARGEDSARAGPVRSGATIQATALASESERAEPVVPEELRKKLEESVDLAFDDRPLLSVAGYLQEFASVDVVVVLEGPAADRVEVTLIAETTLGHGIDLICWQTDLAWTVENGVVKIGKAVSFRTKPMTAAVPRVPPQAEEALGSRIDLSFDETPLLDVFAYLQELTGIPIVPHHQVPGMPTVAWDAVPQRLITVEFTGPLTEALDTICKQAGLAWKLEGPFIKVGKPERVLEPKEELKLWLDRCEETYDGLHDYTCIFGQRERVNDRLLPEERCMLKFKKPFMIYMKWIGDVNKGQECLYVKGQYDDKLVGHGTGLAGIITLMLDPDGRMAMRGRRHPITQAGIGHLLNLLRKDYELAAKHGEGRVIDRGKDVLSGRELRVLACILPADRRPEYYCHRAVVGFDRQLVLPVSVSIYDGKDRLLEQYAYEDLKLDIGLSEKDFDRDSGEYGF